MLSEDLRRAYHATNYHVFTEPAVVLHPGETNSAADALLAQLGARSGIVLTAWNPMSEPTSDATNAAAQALLASAIARLGLQTIPAEGRGIDTSWPPETSFFIPGMSDSDAANLAVQFRQAAWVSVAIGEPVLIVETDFCPGEP